MRYQTFWIWWLLTLGIKLILTYFLPLFPDEAYYWVWSKNPQLSYYDHPPTIAFLFYIGQVFEDFGHAVRWPSLILAHFSFVYWFRLWKDLTPFSGDSVPTFLWLALLMPLPGVGTMIATPDAPLLFFTSAFLWHLYSSYKNNHWFDYLLLGLCTGLGMVSKYHMVLILPCLIRLLWMRRTTPNFLLNATALSLAALVAFSPVLLWNYWNEWISFRFQLGHGLGASTWNWQWTVTYVMGQIFLLTPWVLFTAYKKKVRDEFELLVKIFAFTPILFFLITSLRGKVEGNWPIQGHWTLLLMFCLVSSLQIQKRLLLGWGLVISLALSMALFPKINVISKLNEGRQFDSLLPVIESQQPIYARSFQMAAVLSYKSKRMIHKLKGLNRVDLYDFLNGSIPTENKFTVIVESQDSLPLTYLEKGYAVISREPVGTKFELMKVERLK